MSEFDYGVGPPTLDPRFTEPEAQLGQRERPRPGRPSLRQFQGHRVRPLDGKSLEAPAQRGDLRDVQLELANIAALLNELVEVDSGEVIVARQKLVLRPADPFFVFTVEAPDNFHSLKVDNPSADPVEIVFGGTQPTAANSDERVPAHTGRIITAPYDEVAIGFDPAVVLPAGGRFLYCSFYSRPYSPASYAFI